MNERKTPRKDNSIDAVLLRANKALAKGGIGIGRKQTDEEKEEGARIGYRVSTRASGRSTPAHRKIRAKYRRISKRIKAINRKKK